MTIVLIIIGALLSLAGGIWFLVVAFRQSVVWGLVVIFVPFASLVFLVKYWQDAKASFFVQLIGTVIYFAGAWNMITARLEGRPVASGPVAVWQRHDRTPSPSFDGQPDRNERPTPVTHAEPGASEPAPSESTSANDSEAPTPEAPTPSRLARHEAGEPDAPAKPQRIRLSAARTHIGEPMRITGTNDLVREGTLRQVDGDDLLFDRRLQGGTMSFHMHAKDIARLESLAN